MVRELNSSGGPPRPAISDARPTSSFRCRPITGVARHRSERGRVFLSGAPFSRVRSGARRAPTSHVALRNRADHARAYRDTRLPQSTKPGHPSYNPAQDCSGGTAGLGSCRSDGNDRRRASPSSAAGRSRTRRFASPAARRIQPLIGRRGVVGNGRERPRRSSACAPGNSRDIARSPLRGIPAPALVVPSASRFSLRVVLRLAACSVL
jgi:hypothetical protein